MVLSGDLRPVLTPLRLTLAIALLAVASSGYVVFAVPTDPAYSFDVAVAAAPRPVPCRMPDTERHGPVSFATASP